MKRYVAYYRVSTAKQGRSGLGIDVQRDTVLRFINGGAELVEEYTEVESGRKSDRPALANALRHCRATGATLIVSKLDRLARDVAFLSGLMNSSVEFVVCDFPQANRLTLHIMAAMAEYEARMTSERTKAALVQAKKRGVQLGNPNGARALRKAGKGNSAAVAVVQSKAQEKAADLHFMLEDIQNSGVTSLAGIAAELNARGARPPRAGKWHATTVARLLARLAS